METNSKTLKYNEEPITKYELNKILPQPMAWLLREKKVCEYNGSSNF